MHMGIPMTTIISLLHNHVQEEHMLLVLFIEFHSFIHSLYSLSGCATIYTTITPQKEYVACSLSYMTTNCVVQHPPTPACVNAGCMHRAHANTAGEQSVFI